MKTENFPTPLFHGWQNDREVRNAEWRTAFIPHSALSRHYQFFTHFAHSLAWAAGDAGLLVALLPPVDHKS